MFGAVTVVSEERKEEIMMRSDRTPLVHDHEAGEFIYRQTHRKSGLAPVCGVKISPWGHLLT